MKSLIGSHCASNLPLHIKQKITDPAQMNLYCYTADRSKCYITLNLRGEYVHVTVDAYIAPSVWDYTDSSSQLRI